MKKIIVILFSLFVSLSSCSLFAETKIAGEPVKIYSFNMLRFDGVKAANKNVSAYLASLLQDASLAGLQELTTWDEAVIESWITKIGSDTGYVLSPPLGSSFYYREAFLFIYKKNLLTPEKNAVFPDAQKKFERPPFACSFVTQDGTEFIAINVHIKPDDEGGRTTTEIAALPQVASYFMQLWGIDNCFIIGDFNADGSYYDEKKLSRVFPASAWKVIIPNTVDTTVSPGNDNTYDRIIASKTAASFWSGNWGVVRFTEDPKSRAVSKTPMIDISDHYPVWAEFF
jgi:endonuclease/exonuclease/phosphatase family metal-dependent hydrolase